MKSAVEQSIDRAPIISGKRRKGGEWSLRGVDSSSSNNSEKKYIIMRAAIRCVKRKRGFSMLGARDGSYERPLEDIVPGTVP